ncbi:MAG: methyltransferase [Anaerolineales bacterium]|jgi:protein-S-isoprenylcysteine O-methyltransferase Ste14
MGVFYLTLLGLTIFVMGVGILGYRLRRRPSKVNAEKLSRIAHLLFFAGLVTPPTIMIFYPGYGHIDELVGLNSLPLRPFFLITGILLVVPGLIFFVLSNKSLRALGDGANAFRLTKRIVETDVYRYTRNPMSLGYYLLALSITFISGSTLLAFGVLLGLIPAHLFFLKFFEELELELRFGESYKQYKQEVPFLIPKPPSS